MIYYAGPTPGREGQLIGSCGPTLGRMDKFTPSLFPWGFWPPWARGREARLVVEAHEGEGRGGVYFCAVGGAGAWPRRASKAARSWPLPIWGANL